MMANEPRTYFPKGDGNNPFGTRWVMRGIGGNVWTTTGRYTLEEVRRWEMAQPVRPAENL